MTATAGDGIDPALVEAFRRDGFVVVPGLLEPAELDEFAPRVDAAVARRTARYPPLAERSAYEQSFLQCINLWEEDPVVRRLSFHPRIGAAAARLIGADCVRLWHDQALYKEAGGRETDPHQDQPYWPIQETDTVTAWVPLVDVTEELGCMGYVPGSHRVGLRKFINIFFGHEREDVLAHPALAGTAPVFVEVPRGSVAFHHGLTVHLARPNRSGTVRRVHTMIYFRDGCTRSATGTHQSVERGGIRPGDPIQSDATPVAWPRPPGDLPPPPATPVDPRSIGARVWPGGAR